MSLTLHWRDALMESVIKDIERHVQRIFRNIFIETSAEHLMFVRKCQAILKNDLAS